MMPKQCALYIIMLWIITDVLLVLCPRLLILTEEQKSLYESPHVLITQCRNKPPIVTILNNRIFISAMLYQVVAVNVTDALGAAYFAAYFSNGLVTDSSWKCHYEHETGWETPNFDDSHWSPAETGRQYPVGHGRAAQEIRWWRDKTAENSFQCHGNQMFCRYSGCYGQILNRPWVF